MMYTLISKGEVNQYAYSLEIVGSMSCWSELCSLLLQEAVGGASS